MRSRNVAVADCCGGQDGWTTDSSSALRQELTHGEARCATGNCARMPFLSADTGRAAGGISNVSAITSHQGVPSRPVLSVLSHHHRRRLACYLLPACLRCRPPPPAWKYSCHSFCGFDGSSSWGHHDLELVCPTLVHHAAPAPVRVVGWDGHDHSNAHVAMTLRHEGRP